MNVQKDFEEFIAALNSNGVRYLVVGGYALAYHARPRATKDIDFWIARHPVNAERAVQAIRDFGFKTLRVDASFFSKPGQVLVLGVAPIRIDLLTSIDGVTFDVAWKHRRKGKFGAQWTFFIGREELIRNKLRAGRPQDMADVACLRLKSPPRRRRS